MSFDSVFIRGERHTFPDEDAVAIVVAPALGNTVEQAFRLGGVGINFLHRLPH